MDLVDDNKRKLLHPTFFNKGVDDAVSFLDGRNTDKWAWRQWDPASGTIKRLNFAPGGLKQLLERVLLLNNQADIRQY